MQSLRQQRLDQNQLQNYNRPLLPNLYFVLASSGIFAIAILLHFWQLGAVPYPVFDEVLFGKYAEEYLDGAPTWEGHPPLGKFFIMIGLLLFGRNEIGYRVIGAGFGAIAPLLVIGLIYRLTYKRNLALLSGLFVCSDGLFLVESRLGLLNIFLVTLGLASQIFLIAGLEQKGNIRTFFLCCAGLMLGAAASIKWNGLGFSLLLFGIVLLVFAIAKLFPKQISRLGIFAEVLSLHWWQYLLCFGIMPIAFYLVQWIPLFMLNSGGVSPESGLGAIHAFGESLIKVHQHIHWWHNTEEVMGTPNHPSHPYCSTVLSWAVSARPVGYYFQDREGFFIVMQGLGNPLLWWLSTLAIAYFTFNLGISSIRHFLSTRLSQKLTQITNISFVNYFSIYLLLGYFANYLPWLLVKRCLFIYHYMSASVFSFVALSWLTCKLIEQKSIARYLGYAIIAIVLLSFLFFLPIWIGLPISHSAFYERMWFMPDKVLGFNWI